MGTRRGGPVYSIRVVTSTCRHPIENCQIDVARETLHAAIAHDEIHDATMSTAEAVVLATLRFRLRAAGAEPAVIARQALTNVQAFQVISIERVRCLGLGAAHFAAQ